MKKKLPSAKPPLPKFKSDQTAVDYFDDHSIADVWDELPEAKPPELSATLEAKIRDRHARAKPSWNWTT